MNDNNSKKVLSFFKTNEGKQIIGLVLGLAGCVICWGERTSGILWWKKAIDGTPDFGSGLLSMILVAIMYFRKLVDFERLSFKYMSIIMTFTIGATLISLFLNENSLKEDTLAVGVVVFCITSSMFSMKGIAKASLIFGFVFWLLFRIGDINCLLRFWGFVALLFFFTYFYLLDFVKFDEFMLECKQLWNKSIDKTKDIMDEAADDMQDIGEMAAEVSSASMGVPNPMNAHKKKKHNSSAPEQSVNSDDGNLSYFKNHSSCLFSTAVGCIGDGKPVDYLYRFEKFWIFVQDSPEVSAISTNPNVSMIISDGGKEVKVDGKAEFVNANVPEYNFYLRYRQIPYETIKALPITMRLIKVSATNVSVG